MIKQTLYSLLLGTALSAFAVGSANAIGGWLSDKLGGARVTQWDTWIMVGSTILAGYLVSSLIKNHSPCKHR